MPDIFERLSETETVSTAALKGLIDLSPKKPKSNKKTVSLTNMSSM